MNAEDCKGMEEPEGRRDPQPGTSTLLMWREGFVGLSHRDLGLL